MKKCLFVLAIAFFTIQYTQAQDLNRLMVKLSEVEGAQKQVVDKEMLDASLKAAMESDSTGQLASNMPPFMQKIKAIEVVSVEKYNQEVKNWFSQELESFKDGNGYATLLRVENGNDNVRIISHKGENIETSVFILVLDNEDAVVVKMSGDLNESDLMDIVKEQNKNK